jgi:hypothetical protein
VIDARLDATLHRISAKGSILFENTSSAPVDRLFFHLYLNAFENDRTLFLRSPLGAGRAGRRATRYGYIDVKHLSARELGGVDLWKNRAPHSPGDPEDRTDIEVPLPRSVEPGARLSLEFEFEAVLPEILERTGYSSSFHFLGQWFPKLARLEPDGSFAHFPFHSQAEFYADFGRYDVTLDVPASYVVGATGRRVSEHRQGDRRQERYLAEPVHDFAWTAWDGFREQRARVGSVDVRILIPEGYDRAARVSLDTVRFALPELSRRFGDYPYPDLTVVHPPDHAAGAGGMEYPTLITTGGSRYAPFTGIRSLEAVTVHELAHQWFYGLLASNEARYPFLDEGLTSFAELVTLRSRFGEASLGSGFGLTVSAEAVYRAAAALHGGDEPIASPAAEFTSFTNLGLLAYFRAAVLLETLGRVYGRAALDRALADYAAKYRFEAPTPQSLIAEIGEKLGPDAARVLERGLFERGRVNFLVREIRSAQVPPGHHSQVTVYREGILELPVEVSLISADGTRRREHWDGKGTSRTFVHRGDVPLSHVVVDPEYKVLLDDDLFDNQVSRSPRAIPRIHERLAYVGALLLGGFAP